MTLGIRRYGPEVFGFLIALHRDDEEARDVFGVFSENLWKAFPSFRWDSSFRTWAYTVARNTSRRHVRRLRRDALAVPLSVCDTLSELEAELRTATAEYLRTETKDRFARLRASLTKEDQALLILRIDKKLPWPDLARVLGEPDGLVDEAELKRASARLRKRFQTLKERLVEMARREGLIAERRNA